jgi:hypothetical protein
VPGSARRATVAVMILALVLMAAPVAQAKKQYPPRTPSCSVYPMQVYVGQTVTLTGKNWKPSSTVTFTYRRGTFTSSLGSTTTDSNGSFTTTAVIPAGGSGRKAYIDFVGPGPRSSSVQCTVTLKIVPAPTSSSASASTPISVTGGMLLGLGVLGLSVWLSAAHRRRARALRT